MKRTSAFVVLALLFGCVDPGLAGPSSAGPDPVCSVTVGGGEGQQREWERCVNDVVRTISEDPDGPSTFLEVCETEAIRGSNGRVTGYHIHCAD